MAKKKVTKRVNKGRDAARSIRVPDDEWQEWQLIAKLRGVTLSKFVREVVSRACRNERKKQERGGR